jgi:hypothetical protein
MNVSTLTTSTLPFTLIGFSLSFDFIRIRSSSILDLKDLKLEIKVLVYLTTHLPYFVLV